MKTYIRKPIIVEAIRVDGFNAFYKDKKNWPKWFADLEKDCNYSLCFDKEGIAVVIRNGYCKVACEGDWIVKNRKNELFVLKYDEFSSLFDEVPESYNY